MSAAPWWDNIRTPIAFLVAPFVVPLIVAVFVLAVGPKDTAAAVVVAFSAVSAFVSYFGAFIFGVPTYLFLRARPLTAFWIAPVAGFIAGAVMLYVFFALFWLSLGNGPSAVGSALADSNSSSIALKVTGPFGALVGTILWLIARPDRRTRRQSYSGQSEG
jgi:hypothetical protein